MLSVANLQPQSGSRPEPKTFNGYNLSVASWPAGLALEDLALKGEAGPGKTRMASALRARDEGRLDRGPRR